jgi:mannose-6-phosphate isomerase-like protein (cupin superfamily)
MQIFSIHDSEDHVLCDTPTCYADLRRYRVGEAIGHAAQAHVETVLCVVEGELTIQPRDGEAPLGEAPSGEASLRLGAMQGAHVPAGGEYLAAAGAPGARVLRVDSPHPGFDPTRALMPALGETEVFAVTGGTSLTYTDYFRSAVLTFAPGFAADKHFHQGADELFWFFSGTARVTTPDGEVVLPEGSIIINPAGEWHVIANDSDTRPLLMFLTVAPNVVPSHTFFDMAGRPVVRSMQPLTHL